MRKLILTNLQSPGDIVMLTAALRDLHRCYPGEFQTDVRTSCPALWENNPYLTPMELSDPGVELIGCRYPLVNYSNERPVHFLCGFIEFLNEYLGLNIKPTEFKGDIHLSACERSQPSAVQQITGVEVPYWIVVAGGKYDFTIKWWHFRRWQAVVDHFRAKLLFVQVGEQDHYHPPLRGAIDLRGKTSLRELVRLVYHAQGVLCPITLVMHLAAAVETKPGMRKSRPCVVVAGGREAPHWTAYPSHQFIHTIGALPCCAEGGCWRCRTVPLDDGHEFDNARHLCLDVRDGLPHCMNLIQPSTVIERIELLLAGGLCAPLREEDIPKLAPYWEARNRVCPLGEATFTSLNRPAKTKKRRPISKQGERAFPRRDAITGNGSASKLTPSLFHVIGSADNT